MSRAEWERLLLEPEELTDDALPAWFDTIALRLLCGCQLLVADVPHRLTEVEFYYYGGNHLDLFAHRDPIQKHLARWYFHRTGGVYRSGSFKGFDLTFGGPAVFGGILIRGLEQERGPLIDGPSLSVDHLLRTTGAADVATLDEAIDGRPAWDADNPLRLLWSEKMIDRPVLRTARVGLSLKKLRPAEAPARFLLKPYRYLSEPREISKGKVHMVLALHIAGMPSVEIRERTGCTRAAVERYITEYEEGQHEPGFDAYFGLELGPRELCRLHGLWQTRHG